MRGLGVALYVLLAGGALVVLLLRYHGLCAPTAAASGVSAPILSRATPSGRVTP